MLLAPSAPLTSWGLGSRGTFIGAKPSRLLGLHGWVRCHSRERAVLRQLGSPNSGSGRGLPLVRWAHGARSAARGAR
eukprot:15077001-Alexandrium_andersonii.AAC.1